MALIRLLRKKHPNDSNIIHKTNCCGKYAAQQLNIPDENIIKIKVINDVCLPNHALNDLQKYHSQNKQIIDNMIRMI